MRTAYKAINERRCVRILAAQPIMRWALFRELDDYILVPEPHLVSSTPVGPRANPDHLQCATSLNC